MTKLKTITAIAALSLAGFTAGFAVAQPGGDHSERWAERLAEIDTDGDGTISKAESEAPLEERFTSADTDGDGVLSFEEITAFTAAEREDRRAFRQQRRFDRLDANEDGFIDADEFAVPATKMFENADTDGDGFITEAESEAAAQSRRGKRRGPRGPQSDAG